MGMDLSSDELKWVFVTLFRLVKTKKRHSLIMMGKLREWNHFANRMAVVCHLWTWHLSAYHSVNWVFTWLTSWSNFMSHVTPLSISKEWIVHSHIVCPSSLVMLPSLFLCHPMFKGKKEVYPYSWNNLCVSTLSQSYGYIIYNIPIIPSLVSSMWDSSWPSFDETIPVNFNSSSKN